MDVPPLSRRERVLLVVAAVATAASRVLALAKTPWDWDELLFILGVRRFDVAVHHPHPPGFPLFIAAGKLLRFVVHDEFRALQLVDLFCGVALLPAAFYLARQLGMRFTTALSAALLLAFLPNVWFYGGTALSDVPSLMLVVLACALLLHGRERRAAYVAGAVVLAIAAGVRPQNLLIGFLPALLATRAQLRRGVGPLSAAALLAGLIVAGSYAAAMQSSGGWDAYRHALQQHQQYIAATDSVFSPLHPPVWQTLDDFFFWPFRDLPLNLLLTALIAVSLASLPRRRDRGLLILLGTFGPFALFALLLLDFNSVSRFSVGYAPLFAFLAADGAAVIGGRLGRLGRLTERGLVTAALLLAVVFTAPALRVVREETSPPVAAVQWLAAHAGRHDPIEVQTRMAPYADAYLAGFALEPTGKLGPPAGWTDGRPWFLSEVPFAAGETVAFRRPPGALWNLVRHRYFEAYVYASPQVRFGDGWYGEEHDPAPFRWMAGRATVTLPPTAGPTELGLELRIPPQAGAVSLTLDGTLLARIPAGYSRPSIFTIKGRGRPSTLLLETEQTFRAPGDPRALGLSLRALTWQESTPLAR